MPTESCSCWNLNPSYLSHQNAVLVGIYTPSCSGTTTLSSDTYNKSLKATLNNKRTTPLIGTFLDRQKTVRLSTTLSLSLSLSLSLCLAFLTLRLFFCYIFFLFWVLVFQSISAMKILFFIY